MTPARGDRRHPFRSRARSEQRGPRALELIVDLLDGSERGGRLGVSGLPMVRVSEMAAPIHPVRIRDLAVAGVFGTFPYRMAGGVLQIAIDRFAVLVPRLAGKRVGGPGTTGWSGFLEAGDDEVATK